MQRGISRMLDWSTSERRNRIPAELRPAVPTAKGLGPYFVGREEELALLESRHKRQPEEVPDKLPADEASFITVVNNAPGVGKSALLERFRRRYTTSGGYTLELTAHALTSDDALRDAIRTAPAVQAGTIVRTAGKVADIVATASGANYVQAGMKTIALAAERIGVPIPKRLRTKTEIGIAVRMAKAHPDLGGIQLMQVLSESTDGGVLIMIDEAQELGELPSARHETATLLQQLGDPSLRAGLGLRSGGLVLAGLPDTHKRMRQLHKSRAFSMPLNPLPEPDVKTLLQTAWQRGYPFGDQPSKAHRAIIDKLLRDFHSWTHHAYGAAVAAERILSRIRRLRPDDPRRPTDAQLLEWLRTSSALTACQLYDQTANLAADYVGPDGVHQIVLEINRTGSVQQKTLTRLFNRHRKRASLDDIGEVSNRVAFQRLLHCGLIERERDVGGGLTGRLTVPIPSLARYLAATEGRAARSLTPSEASGSRRPRKK